MNEKRNEEDVINNWDFWIPTCGINLVKDDEEGVYNPNILLFSDDGDEDDLKCIITQTEIYSEDPLEAIRIAADAVHILYDVVYETVSVMDLETGDFLEETYTLTEAFGEKVDEEVSEQVNIEM